MTPTATGARDGTPPARAVVVGAGMSGLLAARELSEHVAEVVVVDRDEPSPGGLPRRGVPQGRHPHVLLARGRDLLDDRFPGFTAEVVERGGLLGDLTYDGRLFVGGGYLARYRSGLVLLGASRPLLEGVVRDRVAAIGRVRLLDRTDVVGLVGAGGPGDGSGRVTGVRARARDGGQEQELEADLVVCATGRSAAAIGWLERLGYRPPPEERIGIDLTYVTRRFRRRPGDLDGARHLLVAPAAPQVRGAGAFAQEGDLWLVGLIGAAGERPPTDLAGFRRYAASLPAPEVADLLREAEPVGEPAVTHVPASRRRFFERGDWPEGHLVVGDAISSFNPVYGQGMTVAAEQSLLLGRAVAGGTSGLARRFYPAAARVIDVPWTIAAGGDLAYPQVPGRRRLTTRLTNAYVARLLAGARRDPVLAQAFAQTNNLLAGPASLLRPAVLARVVVGGRAPRSGRPGAGAPDPG